MNLFKRIGNIFKAEAHSALDKWEDKIKLFEQKIRDVNEHIKNAMAALAKLKTEESLMESKISKKQSEIESFQTKAEKLKQSYMSIEDEQEKNKLKSMIETLLSKMSTAKSELDSLVIAEQKQEQIRVDTENKIKQLKEMASKYSSQISTLKAQQEAAKANKAVSKELSSFNVDGLNSEFEKLTQDVERDIAEADAWTSMGETFKSEEDKIDEYLSKKSTSTSFDDFMKS